ncbi:hypothetical protein KBA73_00985 [Patescibacteria group bacterium]|nr:hypothetical protein [Patescibacteria group bacterium]
MTHLVLFSQAHVYLGDLFFEEGALEKTVLTPQGEGSIGEEVASWSLKGIPHALFIDRPLADKSIGIFLEETMVRSQSAEAEKSIRHWANRQGLKIIDLPPRLVLLWEGLAQLDLEDEERFQSLHAIRHASHRNMLAWQKAIQEVCKTVNGSSSFATV